MLRLGLLLALLWGGVLHAQSLTEALPAGKCFAAERSVVLYDADSALSRGVLSDQETFDLDRARIRPIARDRPPSSTAFCVDGRFDASGLETEDLSEALFNWPVVVVVTPDDVAPIRLFAHVPELAYWAGHPLVEVGAIGWEGARANQEDDTEAASMLDLMAAAEDLAISVAAFSQGDLEAAVGARPAPDDLSLLAQAWLSGIPASQGGQRSLFGRLLKTYEGPPSRGGQNAIDLITAVATGAISPTSAIELSTPARDVICDWGASRNRAEIRWAGFVAGFWHLSQTGDIALDPNARLDRLSDELAGSRTCFANALVKLLDVDADGLSSEALRERLDSLVGATMASSATVAERRRQLAAEMLAATIGYSVMSFEEDNQSDYLQEITSATWLGRCSGPDLRRADRLSTLPELINHAPESPLALLLDIADIARSERPGLFDDSLLNDSNPNAWLKSVPELGTVILTSLRPVDVDVATRFERWIRPEAEASASAAVDILIFADDAEFAEARPAMLDSFFGFDDQSDLARELLWRSIKDSALTLYSGGRSFAFLEERYQTAYQRLVGLAPWMTSPAQLDVFFNGSYEGAVKVAEVDLLNLLYSVRLIDLLTMDRTSATRTPGLPASLALPPPHRNPWLRFAPQLDTLPELPIPGIDTHPSTSAWSVALSAAVHDAVAMMNGQLPGEDINTDRYAAILSVVVDATYRSVADRYSADLSYLPNDSTRQMYAAMKDGLAEMESQDGGLAAVSPGLSEMSLPELITIARLGWQKGIGEYLVSEWSEDASQEVIAERARDLELGARLLLALLLPGDIDAIEVAVDVDRRLQEGTSWPPVVQRMVARLAIHLLKSDAIDPGVNTASLLAELDDILSVEARQNLIDAGFMPAAVIGVPIRLTLATYDAGGLENLTSEHIFAALRAELAQFDFKSAFEEGAWSEPASAFSAYAHALAQTDLPISEDEYLATTLRSPEFRGLLDYSAELYPSLDISSEAQTLADVMMLESVEQATEDLDLGLLVNQCPELAPTLLAWSAYLQSEATFPETTADKLALLRNILATGDQFRTIYSVTEVRIAAVSVHFVYSQGIPLFASDQSTGGINLGTSASRNSEAPWQLQSQIGVTSTVYEGSPALAAALGLAEWTAAMEGPDVADDLAPLLVALEAIAFGDTLDPASASPAISPHRSEVPLGMLLGKPLPPTNTAAPRIGDLPMALPRLVKLAARAEELGLNAMARRIAGIALSVALERATIDDAIAAADDPFSNEAPPEPTNAEILKAFITGERQISGNSISQVASAGIADFPQAWITDALCADVEDNNCQATTRFATRADIDDITDVPTLPVCERLARAVMTGGSALAGLPRSPDCNFGPLGMDILATSFATDPQPDLFQQYAAMGFVNTEAFADNMLLRQAAVAASEVPYARQATIFDDAARLAFYLNNPKLVVDFATLRLIAEIADPTNTGLAAETRADTLEMLDTLGTFIDPAQVAFVQEIVDGATRIDAAQRRDAQNFLDSRLRGR